MGIDWEFVGSLTEQQLKDSEDEFHQDICEILRSDINESDLTDSTKVKHLLRIAGLVIEQKTDDLQAVESYGTELVNNAENKIVKLQSELKAKESAIGDLQLGGTGKDARYMRDELRTLEAENEKLKKDMKDLGTETSSSRVNIEKITNEYMECKAVNRMLENDNDQLKKDILDLKNQMEAQREALMLKRDGDEGRLMKRIQSQEHTRFMSEIHELSEANEFLKDEIEEVTKKLNTATEDLVKLTEEFSAMKTVITETDKANARLEEENEGMKLQVQDLQEAMLEQGNVDSRVMSHVNTEVEKWQKLLSDTEEQLVEQRKKNHILTQQLDATKLDADKKVMAELAQAVTDKDKQIQELKTELDEGYKQMQLMGEFAEELQATEAVKETNHLESLVSDYKNVAKAERERLRKVEADSAERDKQLAEALTRIGQYENGTYGLREAVQEIKDLKKQVSIRDSDISTITKQINKLEMNLCQALDENDEMRRRLGLEPSENIDLSELKFTKAAEQEQLRAINRLLSAEVERLERERIEMKKILRKQAMHRGVRAVELGLKTEDLEAIEEAAAEAGLTANDSNIMQEHMIEKFQDMKSEDKSAAVELRKDNKTIKVQNINLNKAVEDINNKNTALIAKLTKTENEKERFEAALTEALKGKVGKLQDQPDLHRLLSLMEDKLNQSYPDLTQHLKSQVAQLNGRNMELRAELTRTKEEIRRCERERANAVADLARFAPTGTQGIPGPAVQGSQQLAHQLVVALQEIDEKEGLCKEMERQLLHTQDQLSRLTAQQGMLYEEHYKLKIEMKRKPTPQSNVNQSDNVEVFKEELERLQKVLEQSGADQKKSISDGSRRMVLLKVHERTMRRELAALYEREEANEREIKRLKMLDDYRVKDTRERLSWLEQYKDTATTHISQLREQLLTCVPQRDVEKLFDLYTSITNKYRKLLEEESLLQECTQKMHKVQEECDQSQVELADCQTQLLLKNQRCERLEERLAAVNEPTRDGETSSLEDKIYSVEVQLVNEKQKASHAIKKHSKLLSVTQELEERNTTLEQKFTNLVEKNNSLQDREKTLTADLDAATKYGGKDSRTTMLEKQVVALQAEVKRAQTAADISADQTRTLLARKDQKEKEIEQHRQTLAEIQKQTDDKLTIGLLTQKLVEVQNRDIESSKLVEEFKIKLSQGQGKLLVMEAKLADHSKLQDLQHKKVVSHVQLLSRTICYLRGQYTGAVPLQRQQRLGEAVRALINEKKDLSLKLAQSEKDRCEMEVEVEHLKSAGGKQTLTSASKIRLSEMRLKREVTQLKQQILFLEKVVADHEETIRELEDENTGVYDLLTEQKNLDTSVATVEMTVARQTTDRNTANRQTVDRQTVIDVQESVRKSTGYHLCGRCKHKIGAKDDAKSSKIVSLEIDYLNKQLEKKEDKIKVQKEEAELLKTSLNTAHNRVTKLNKDVDKLEEKLATKSGANPDEYSSFKKSQASAQQVIGVLNERIDQKDEALKKYQDMLQDLRSEAISTREKHERELLKLSKEHSYKEKEWLSKYQELSAELQSLQEVGASPTPHKRAELEELILEQDKANAMLRDNMFKLRQEISDLKTERISKQKGSEKDIDKLKTDNERKVKKFNSDISELTKRNSQLLGENEQLAEELKSFKKAKSPRGKSESTKLAEKDEEIGKLKDALAAVRQEMTLLIEEKMRENVSPVMGTKVEKRDPELLRSKVVKLQKERDVAIREKGLLESQLATKSNPRQAAEIDTLQKQLTVQREKMTKLKTAPVQLTTTVPRKDNNRILELEKELEELKREASSKPPGTVIDAWLDNKKWTKKIENQKKLIDKKAAEIETLTKQNTSMRETVERMDREKVLLNNKLKNAIKLSSKADKAPTGYTDTQIYTQELKRKIFELEEDNIRLKDDLTRKITNPLAEKDQTIAVMQNTVAGLEKHIQDSCQEETTLIELNKLRQLNTEQAKKLIKCEHELLSVKLRAEHAELELPRLRTRVNDLQAYADVLKPNSFGKSAPPPPPTPGKSVVELERVINAMKRVIEKLQKDNSQMKDQIKSLAKQESQSSEPPAESDETKSLTKNLKASEDKVKAVQSELDSRAEENAGLKIEIEKLGASVVKLQGNLEKSERAAKTVKSDKENCNTLQRQLAEQQELVTEAQVKVQRGEDDIKRKNGLLSEIRRRLKGVAERENDLEEEIRLLHECKMPNGAKEIAKEAVRLKRENTRLSDHLQQLRKPDAPGLDPIILEKLEEFRADNDVMVKKIVFYQKQLNELAEKHPNDGILIDFPK